MTRTTDSPSSVLGAELAGALHRSLQTSMTSLASLRNAVRVYTVHERDRGMSLDALLDHAVKALATAEDDRSDSRNNSVTPDVELLQQLEMWCREDFAASA